MKDKSDERMEAFSVSRDASRSANCCHSILDFSGPRLWPSTLPRRLWTQKARRRRNPFRRLLIQRCVRANDDLLQEEIIRAFDGVVRVDDHSGRAVDRRVRQLG